MEHVVTEPQSVLTGLWAELTWHTLIEVIAIIVAAIIVHPIIKLIGRQLDKLSQIIATSSRNNARKRIKYLFEFYSLVSIERERLSREPLYAILRPAEQNLESVSFAVLIIIVAASFEIVSLPIAAVLYTIFLIRYNRIQKIRRSIMDFDLFRINTKRDIIELREKADFEPEFCDMWQVQFDELASTKTATALSAVKVT
jgi:hypothetical protein